MELGDRFLASHGKVAHAFDGWDVHIETNDGDVKSFAFSLCNGSPKGSFLYSREASVEPLCKKCEAVARNAVKPYLNFLGKDLCEKKDGDAS